MGTAGELISIFFKGSFDDGTVFQDRSSGEPFVFATGKDLVPPGLESAVCEMEIGEERTIELSAEESFGEYRPDGVLHVPAVQVPNYHDMPVGEYIQWLGEEKRKNAPTYAKVVSVDDYEVVVDLNHPFAGRKTVFWVKVVDKGPDNDTDIDRMLNRIRKEVDKANSMAALTGDEGVSNND